MKYIIIFAVILSFYSFFRKGESLKNSAQHKGIVGEKRVKKILQRLSNKKYIVINDIMVPSDSDIKHTQIDHIVISTHGIFVIETKNYSGIVYGKANSEYWYKDTGSRVLKFRNPLKQNYAHIMGLQKALNMKQESFISIAAFSDKCILNIDNDTDSNVVNFKDLKSTIKSYRDILIDKSQLITIKDKIYEYNIHSSKIRDKHAKVVQRKIDSEKPYMNICPLCGCRLIKKQGRYGYFMGCSNYPKCRFTSDI